MSNFSTAINFFDDYVPEFNEIDIDMIRNSQSFRKKRYIDAMYFGEISDNKRSGQGIMKYKSGRLYEGNWELDIRSGRGYEKYQNGNLYLGAFDKGKAHG
jgi:hypothetical protein